MADNPAADIGEESSEVLEKRDRTPTEKGLAWQIDNHVRGTRSLISRWHRRASQLNSLLSDSEDSKIITKERDGLISIMNELSKEYDNLNQLTRSS
ncbi:hypothetical protein DPMN_138473 [Dreissena polymorpha]|uniref:Uncharacterized protein n=1 Tax=Dreissena polymorpha TaxID=45954 RepID=A0A9D4G4J4_DREPO|nr:hypothetical protein DPMN_138473 [Dreissena polymorpha]